MKILFVLPCVPFFPSGIVRAQRYFPFLDQENIQYKWFNFNAPFVQRMLHRLDLSFLSKCRVSDFVARVCIHLSGIPYRWFRLIQIVCSVKDFDVIFLQAVLPPVWFSKILCFIHHRVVFDYDDALYLRNEARTKTIIQSAWKVIAGSHVLLDYASSYNKEAFLLPSCIPWDAYVGLSEHQDHEPLRLGWIGSVSTLNQLSLIREPLLNLLHRGYTFDFLIAGSRNQDSELEKNPKITIINIPEYTESDLPSIVEKIDIGVMPLLDLPAERGKCGLKTLIYMAGGIPTVSSPVGAANFIIDEAQNGFLAKDPVEWTAKLEMLLNDKTLRRKFALEGRKTIEDHYTDKKCFLILKNEILIK